MNSTNTKAGINDRISAELSYQSAQLVAATASDAKQMDGAGHVGAATVYYQTKPAAGESMVIDIRKNGVSILTGTLTLDDTAPVGPGTAIFSLDATKIAYVDGDILEVKRTYVAGGGPAPLGFTFVQLTILPS